MRNAGYSLRKKWGRCLIPILLPLLAVPMILRSQGSPQPIDDQISFYLERSAGLINKNLDSAIVYAEMANTLIENLSSDSARVEVYINLGDVYLARGNYPLATKYYYNAKERIDDLENSNPGDSEIVMKQAELTTKLGTVYFFRKNLEQALIYYLEGLQVLNKITDTPSLGVSNKKLKLMNNIAAVYIQQAEYDKALDHCLTAIETGKTENDPALGASLLNNTGICYLEKGDFNLSRQYFEESLWIRLDQGDKRGQAQCYNNLGKTYAYTDNLPEAKKNFLKALELGRAIGNRESVRLSLESLSQLYATLGDYRNAFDTFLEFKILSDSLNNAESASRMAQIEMQYQTEKQQKLFDLELKRREAEKQKLRLVYLLIGGTLFFLLLTSLMLIFLQRSKIRNTRLEKEKLTDELDFRNRELTANVMYLLKKNKMITSISEKLIKSKTNFKAENQQLIQEIISELKSNQDADAWAEFETRFTQVHTDFYKKLHDRFPNLTNNEIKLCAFLRLNMSTKDISAITYQSVNSITVARSRLRKKLNIEGEDINLVNFLMQF